MLYYDPNAKTFKKGAGGKAGGSVRRLVSFIRQIDLTYDLRDCTSEQFLSLLPSEFDKFKGLTSAAVSKPKKQTGIKAILSKVILGIIGEGHWCSRFSRLIRHFVSKSRRHSLVTKTTAHTLHGGSCEVLLDIVIGTEWECVATSIDNGHLAARNQIFKLAPFPPIHDFNLTLYYWLDCWMKFLLTLR